MPNSSVQPSFRSTEWQLPPGVTRGLWEYAHAVHIAADYDDYFALNRLFDFDEQVLSKYFKCPPAGSTAVVADLGCGTGRALVPLARRGLRGLAIDLSEQMLSLVKQKADIENLPIDCLQANMVELDCLADESVDYAICLFSTLGMIRGKQCRAQALGHIRRILKPRGVFVLHVHNYWYNLYDPGGPWWLIKNLLRSIVDREVERGDKFFHYRGVANMFLHVFTRRELNGALRRAGFRIKEIISLDMARQRTLPYPWLFGSLRANGWIVVCG